MSASKVQSASNTSVIASVAATFPHAPEAGNLLVAAVTSNVAVGSMAISGWSTGTSVTVGVAGGLIIFYKVSAGNETTVTATGTLATFMDLHIFEYDGIDNASPLDQTSTTADAGSGVTTLSSGTTATLTQANELAFAAIATVGTNGGNVSWSNSYATEITTTDLQTADLITNATTATSSTAVWNTSQRAAGAIVTFFGETGNSTSIKVPILLSKGLSTINNLKPQLLFYLNQIDVSTTTGKVKNLAIANPSISGTFGSNGTIIKESISNISAIKFNAANLDNVSLGNSLNITDRITLFLLMKRNATSASNFPTQFSKGGNIQYFIIANGTTNRQGFNINTSGGEKGSGYPTPPLQIGTWYWIFGSYDKDAGGNNLRADLFTLDGKLLGSASSAQTLAMSASTGSLAVAYDNNRGIADNISVAIGGIFNFQLRMADEVAIVRSFLNS